MHVSEQTAKYTTVMTKVTYLLPRVKKELFTPELVSSDAFLQECVPGNPKFWPDSPPNTFRMTKSVIPFIFSMTIQFTVSVIPQELLPSLFVLNKVPVHRALLLERTKRNPQLQDATAKVKTILAISEVPGGLLVSNVTAVLNSSLPYFAALVLDALGSFASGEGGSTACFTKKFMMARCRELTLSNGEESEDPVFVTASEGGASD
jgi:hypothetical protein